MRCPSCNENMIYDGYRLHAGVKLPGIPAAIYLCETCGDQFDWVLGRGMRNLEGDADDLPPSPAYDHDDILTGLRWTDTTDVGGDGICRQYSFGHEDTEPPSDLYRPPDDRWKDEAK